MRAFEGIRVFDATQGVAGPHCAMLLAQHGADVVKVEPIAGDWGRSIGKKHGEHCAYVSRSGKACLDGVMFGGGVAFSRGELLGSTKVNDPAPKWAPMMAR